MSRSHNLLNWTASLSIGLWLLNLGLAETGGVPSLLLGVQGGLWILWIALLYAHWTQRIFFTRHTSPLKGCLILCGVLAVPGVILTGRGTPTEHLLGVQDESYNLSTALALVRGGHPFVSVEVSPGGGPDPAAWIHQRPAQAQRAKDETDIGATRRAYGFLFFEGDSSTRVRSVFPTGFPGLAAGFGGLFGESAVFWTNTLLLLGLAPAGGLIALRLTNRTGSIGTAVLLLLCPLHLWISRTGFAELMLAYLFLFGLWTLSEWDRKANPVPLALLFGPLPLVKLEGWLGTFAVGIVIIAGLRRHPRALLPFVASYAFILVPVAALLHRGGGGYTLDTLTSVLSTIPWHWLIPVALAALLPLGLRIKAKGFPWPPPTTPTNPRRSLLPEIRAGFIILTVIAFVYFLWLRPALSAEDSFYYWPLEREILSWRESTIPRLTWYFSLPGLLAGFAGVVSLPWTRARGAVVATILIVFTVSFFFLAWDIRNNPVQPYAMRRFIGFGTPLICLGLPALPRRLPLRFSRWTHAIQWLLLAGASGTFLFLAGPLLPARERQGIHARLTEIEETLPANALVYVPTEGPSHRLILPLQLGFQVGVVPVRSPAADRLPTVDFHPGDEAVVSQNPRPKFILNDRTENFFGVTEPLRSFSFEERFLWNRATSRPGEVIVRKFAVHLLPMAPAGEPAPPIPNRKRRQFR